MVNQKYARAYTEVLEIISHFPQEEYSKIPKKKIDYYKENMDKEYSYKIDPKKDLEDQYVSQEANAIIVSLFRDYYATDRQKEKLEIILNENSRKKEEEKYSYDNLFKNNKTEENALENEIEPVNENMQMIEYKETFFTRFKKFILGLFHIK